MPGATVGRLDAKGGPLLSVSDSPVLEQHRWEKAHLPEKMPLGFGSSPCDHGDICPGGDDLLATWLLSADRCFGRPNKPMAAR